MLYNYKCRSCEHTFSRVFPIKDRKIPESEPCPDCGLDKEGNVFQKIGCPSTVSGVSSKDTRPDWFKSRLKEIKKRSGKDNTMSNVI